MVSPHYERLQSHCVCVLKCGSDSSNGKVCMHVCVGWKFIEHTHTVELKNETNEEKEQSERVKFRCIRLWIERGSKNRRREEDIMTKKRSRRKNHLSLKRVKSVIFLLAKKLFFLKNALMIKLFFLSFSTLSREKDKKIALEIKFLLRNHSLQEVHVSVSDAIAFSFRICKHL